MRFKIRIKLILKNTKNEEEYEYIIEEYFKKDYFFTLDTLQEYIDTGFDINDLQHIYDYIKQELKIEDEIFSMINKRKKATKNFSFDLDYDLLLQNSKTIKFYSQGRTINWIEQIQFNNKRYFTIYVDDLMIEIYLTTTQDQKQSQQQIESSPEKISKRLYQPKNISVSSEEIEENTFYNHNQILCSVGGSLKRRRLLKKIRIKRPTKNLKKTQKKIEYRSRKFFDIMQCLF